MGWQAFAGALSAIGPSGKFLSYLQNQKNVNEQKNQNAIDRKFQSDMYGVQQADSIANWNRANNYNSPSQQMQRMKEAGLNPHLIYGSGVQSQVGTPQTPSAPGGNQPAAKNDYSGLGISGEALIRILLMQAQTQNTNANTDNLKVTNDNLKLENVLKEKNITGSNIRNQRDALDYQRSLDTYDQSVKKATLENSMIEANIEGRKASTTFTLSANERAQLKNTADIAKTVQEILESKMRVSKNSEEIKNIKQMLENLKKENVSLELKNLAQEMINEGMEFGAMTTDSPSWRALLKALGKAQ